MACCCCCCDWLVKTLIGGSALRCLATSVSVVLLILVVLVVFTSKACVEQRKRVAARYATGALTRSARLGIVIIIIIMAKVEVST